MEANKEISQEAIKEAKILRGLWQSEGGKLAIKKMEALRDSNVDFALHLPEQTPQPCECTLAFVNRARGINLVLDDIARVISIADDADKKESKRERSEDE